MIGCDNTGRLLYQYATSPLLKGLMLSLTAEYCDLQQVMEDLEKRLDIDLSRGFQLDQIGIIVGQPRPLVYQEEEGDSFVFADPDGTGPWGGEGLGWSGVSRGDIGGRFIGLDADGNPSGALLGAMPDLDYRTLLRARIYSNRATPDIGSIETFLEFALRVSNNRVINGPGSIDLVVGKVLSGSEELIVRSLVPVAAGVAINNIYDPENPAP